MRSFALVVVAACGGGAAYSADAPPATPPPTPDAGDLPIDASSEPPIDAAPIDAPDAMPSGVRVRVLRGAPLSGVPVLFHSPTGALLARGTTDAAGEVVGDVPDGSSATVVTTAPATTQTSIMTVTEVARGDVVVFGSTHPFAFGGKVTVQLPEAPDASPSYAVFGDCGFGSTDGAPTTLGFSIFCAAPSTSMMAIVRSAGDITQYGELVDVPLVAGTTATVPAWTPTVLHTASITGVPAGLHVGTQVAYQRGGHTFYSSVAAGAGTGVPYRDALGGDAWKLIATLGVQHFPGAFQDLQATVADPTAVAFDAGTVMMPFVTAATDGLNSIRWNTDGGGGYDAVYAESIQLDDSSQRLAVWSTLVSGAAPAGIGLPQLPADLAPLWECLPTDTVEATVTLIRTQDPSYAALRQRAFADFADGEIVQRSVSRSLND